MTGQGPSLETTVAAEAAERRSKSLLFNHDGAMSDFLDGIGGECYRAGEEHEIPINERLGLMGPMDKLGMSSFVESGLCPYIVINDH